MIRKGDRDRRVTIDNPVRSFIFITTLFFVRKVVLARTLILVRMLMDGHGRRMDADWTLRSRTRIRIIRTTVCLWLVYIFVYSLM